MSQDRSSLFCNKPVNGRRCTLAAGHESVRFESRPCEHRAHFHAGQWVEACQCCGGPLDLILRTDSSNRLRCCECWKEWNDEQWDADMARLMAQAEHQRRAELRRKARAQK